MEWKINISLQCDIVEHLQSELKSKTSIALQLTSSIRRRISLYVRIHFNLCANRHFCSNQLGSVEGIEYGVETRLHKLEEQLECLTGSIEVRADNSTETRLGNVEQKLEAVTTRLGIIEGAITTLSQRSYTNNRRQAFNYHPPQLELQPYTSENKCEKIRG